MITTEKGLDLTIPMKKAAQKAWPELENLELHEFDVKNFYVSCIKCGESAGTTAYKILAENEWKGYEKEVVCSNCQVREYLMGSNEIFKRTLNQKISQRWWHVPKGLEDANLKNYYASDPITKNALHACVNYVKGLESGQSSKKHNLLMMGNPGTGKSHLAFAIAKYLRKQEIGSVGFTTTGKVLSLIKETYKEGASQTENGILNDIANLSFLVLDDLGAEMKSRDEFSWARSMLFEIINSRLGKPTVYTTNYDDKTISEVVGERVASRLQENTKYINIFTDDYRGNFIVK